MLAAMWGLIWDAVLHSHDPSLASHENLFSLNNPGHFLIIAGLVLSDAGIGGAVWSVARSQRVQPSAIPPGPLGAPEGHTGSAGAFLKKAALAAATTLLLATSGATALALARSAGGQDPTSQHAHDADLEKSASEDAHHRIEEIHAQHHPESDISAATPEQREAARRLLEETIAATHKYRDIDAAIADGYRPPRISSAQMRSAHYSNPAYFRDGKILDPENPEQLVYLQLGNSKPVLAGAVFVVPPGVEPPQPGGPLTIWHDHADTCLNLTTGERRSVDADGNCPEGFRGGLNTGRTPPKMMHVWFTHDLALAYSTSFSPEVFRDLVTLREAGALGG